MLWHWVFCHVTLTCNPFRVFCLGTKRVCGVVKRWWDCGCTSAGEYTGTNWWTLRISPLMREWRTRYSTRHSRYTFTQIQCMHLTTWSGRWKWGRGVLLTLSFLLFFDATSCKILARLSFSCKILPRSFLKKKLARDKQKKPKEPCMQKFSRKKVYFCSLFSLQILSKGLNCK